MKLVIEIPDYLLEHAKNVSEDSNDEWAAMRAIANGLPYEQRPRGEWREYDVSTFRGTDEWGEPKWGKGKKFICKRCGRRTVIRENFCPNCGSDMRKERG